MKRRKMAGANLGGGNVFDFDDIFSVQKWKSKLLSIEKEGRELSGDGMEKNWPILQRFMGPKSSWRLLGREEEKKPRRERKGIWKGRRGWIDFGDWIRQRRRKEGIF
jgi:hypothetical protein